MTKTKLRAQQKNLGAQGVTAGSLRRRFRIDAEEAKALLRIEAANLRRTTRKYVKKNQVPYWQVCEWILLHPVATGAGAGLEQVLAAMLVEMAFRPGINRRHPPRQKFDYLMFFGLPAFYGLYLADQAAQRLAETLRAQGRGREGEAKNEPRKFQAEKKRGAKSPR